SASTYNVTASGTYYIDAQSSAGCWSSASGSLAVTVVPAVPTITSNPSNVTINQGSNTSFTVTASNIPTSYIWEVSTNGGSNWSTVSNGGVYSTATTSILNITAATFSMNGYQYRATAVNACGNSLPSTAAILTVTSNKFWIGIGTVGGTGGTDFNTSANWSPSGVPGATDDAIINWTVSADYTVALSGNATVGSVTINDNTSSGITRSHVLSVGANTLISNGNFNVTNNASSAAATSAVSVATGGTLSIGGNLKLINSNTSNGSNLTIMTNSGTMTITGTTLCYSLNTGTSSTIEFWVGDSPAVTTFTGNVNLDNGTTVSGNAVGFASTTTGITTGTYKFSGNLTLGNRAYVDAASYPTTFLFDGTGTQTYLSDNPIYYCNFYNLTIGSTNNPTVNVVAGLDIPDNILNNLTVNGSSVLNLGTTQINRKTNGGTFALNGTATLKLAGTTSVAVGGTATLIAGSDFPSGFTTNSLNATSTVEYNSLNAVAQTIYSGTTYGNLTVTNGTGSGSTVKTAGGALTVAGNLLINANATFASGTFAHTVAGNWTNNGIFTFNNVGTTATVTFNGSSNAAISGSSTTDFYNFGINKGSNINTVLSVNGAGTVSAYNNCTFTSGLLQINTSGSFTALGNGGGLTVSNASGIHVNAGSLAVNLVSLTDNGLFKITSGTANIGSASGNELRIQNQGGANPGGFFDMQGGTLNIAGRLVNGASGTPATGYLLTGASISGGTITLCTVGNNNATTGSFDMLTSSNLNMSGGTVIFQNQNTNATPFNDLQIINSTGTKSITGGIFQVGNASTPAGKTFLLNSTIPIYDLYINDVNAPTARLVSDITTRNNVWVKAGTLDAATNNKNIIVGGSWTNQGTFSAGTATVTFNSTTTGKTLTGNLSGSSKFYNLTFNGTGGAWAFFSSPCDVGSNFTITNGAVTAPSGNLNVAGTWSNSATFTHNSGTVNLNGTSNQSLTGSVLTVFNNLILNNSNGATLTTDENIDNALTLTLGNLDISNNTLNFNAPASAVAGGPFSSSKMIIADGSGEVRKYSGGFASGLSYTFPIGDKTGSLDYSPITLNFTAANIIPFSSYVGVKVADAKHPNNTNTTEYTTRYWNLSMGSVSSPLYDVNATYVDADVTGTEANISFGKYTGALPWVRYSTTNSVTNTLSGTNITNTSAAFSGISLTPPTVVINPGTSVCNGTILATTVTRDPVITYSWSPSTSLDDPTIAAPTAMPSANTDYTVTITDGNGFTATNTVTVLQTLNKGIVNNTGQTICDGGDPSSFGFSTGPVGAKGTYNYQWYYQDGDVSPTAGTSAIGSWNIIAGATGATYDPPSGLTTTRSYVVQVDATGSPDCDAPTNYQWATGRWLVTVIPDPVLSDIGDQTICTGGTATLTTTASGGISPFTYIWQYSSDGGTIWNTLTDNVPTGLHYSGSANTLIISGDGTETPQDNLYRCNLVSTSSFLGCNTVTTASILSIVAGPTGTAALDNLFTCDATAQLSASSLSAGATITWTKVSGSGSPSSSSSNPLTVTGLTAGTTVYNLIGANGVCPNSVLGTINIDMPTTSSTVLASSASCSYCVMNDGNIRSFYNNTGKLIARIEDDAVVTPGALNETEICTRMDATVQTVMDNLGNVQPYLQRQWTIHPVNNTSAIVTLYFTAAELAALQSRANNTIYQFSGFALGVTKYPGGSSGTFTGPATSNGEAVTAIFSPYGSDFQAQFRVNTFSTFYIHPALFPFSPLPVELTSFTGWNEANENKLQWKTASENNTVRFEIEKSSAAAVWTMIGQVAASGNSNQLRTYGLNDNVPFAGNNYYRLKIIDADGKFTYSNIINIPLGNVVVNNIRNIYPNPTSGQLTVEIQSTASYDCKVMVYDIVGKKVFEKTSALDKGLNTIDLNFSAFAKGAYILHLIDPDGKIHTAKFIKD
ncbi:MAG: hypothetical protein JWN78_3357, partial [Bacteroidota bacterium]|nr:hypothetical protein [Bacteroidota bacterium]